MLAIGSLHPLRTILSNNRKMFSSRVDNSFLVRTPHENKFDFHPRFLIVLYTKVIIAFQFYETKIFLYN